MNVRLICLLAGFIMLGDVSFAQSDIEITDSISTEWGDAGGGGFTPSIPNEPVTSMTISRTTLTLEGGESARLTVTFNPRAKDKQVTWSVANPKVCSVSNNGTVVGLCKGTTIVTATSDADNTFKCTCTVTVTSDYVQRETGWLLEKGIEAPWQMKYIFYPVLDEYVEPANDSRGRTWHDLGYDDSQWQTLTGPMNSDGSGNFLWQGDDNAFCLRREINIPKLGYGVLKFYVNNDDGILFWLNGNLIIDYDDWSFGQYLEYEIPSTAYVEGVNQLAIYICQGGGGACLDYGLWFESRMPDYEILGDVNADGNVDSGDIMALYSVMAGNGTPQMQSVADVNGDGHVDSGDIMAIYNIMATKQ